MTTVQFDNAVTRYTKGSGKYLTQQITVLAAARDETRDMELAAAVSHIMSDLTYQSIALDKLDDMSRELDARLGAEVDRRAGLEREGEKCQTMGASVDNSLLIAECDGLVEGIAFALNLLGRAFKDANDAAPSE